MTLRNVLLLIILGGVFAWAYVSTIRPFLRQRGPFKVFYDGADSFWAALGAWLKGWKTIIWNKFLEYAGWILTAVGLLEQLPFYSFVPPRWFWVTGIIMIVIGRVNVKLRKITDTPMGEAEPVAPTSGKAME